MAHRLAPRLFAVHALASVLCLGSDGAPRKDFSGDSSPGDRYSLRVAPPGAPSPGGPYVLSLRDRTTGTERELLRYPVHVDVSWSRDGRQLAVSDFGDGHRGNAYLFDLRRGPDMEALDLGARLAKDRSEAAPLLGRAEVMVQVQGWQPEIGWTVHVYGKGRDYPRGFLRWYSFTLAGGFGPGRSGPKSLGLGEEDYDAPYFEAAKAVVADRGRPSDERVRAIHELMMRDARRGLAILATLFDDRDARVRDIAAEWLAIRGDRRGLEVLRGWLSEPERAFRAAQRLGNSGRAEYAGPIAERVRAILFSSSRRGWDAESRALLQKGTIALARLGRPEDRGLIFSVANIVSSFRSSGLSALGFVDDPRSRELLWKWHDEFAKRELVRPRIEGLLALSRLSESAAIDRLKRIIRERRGWWLPSSFPVLTEERAVAFDSLRPRDAATFAEAVFEVAAQDPEGPGTFQAWEALGVVELAWSRRPHWKTVSLDMLNKVVIAIDPDLNSLFWRGYEAERVPAKNGEKTLVRQGFGALMFRGSWSWIGE